MLDLQRLCRAAILVPRRALHRLHDVFDKHESPFIDYVRGRGGAAPAALQGGQPAAAATTAAVPSLRFWFFLERCAVAATEAVPSLRSRFLVERCSGCITSSRTTSIRSSSTTRPRWRGAGGPSSGQP